MFVADQPAAVAPAQQPGLIEVVGTRRDRAQKIDRRIYKVRQSPQSAQADLMQLLRGLPAVIVKADGQILLLGSDKVSIMVDEKSGQSVPLAALRGSDIDRIEIITNPSAQFSPQGTGGIINIVLRRKQDDGASGSAAAELSSFGGGKANGSITRKRGAWTYQLGASGGSGRLSRSTYRKERTVEFDGGGTASNSEDGGGSSSMTDGSLSGRLAYELDSKTRLSAALFGGTSGARSGNDARFGRLAGDFVPFSERQRSRSATTFLGAELNFDRSGSADGETLKASARMFGNPRNRQTLTDAFEPGDDYFTERGNRLLFADAKIDWTHPIGANRILTLGSSFDFKDASRSYLFAAGSGDQALAALVSDAYDFRETTLSAFATYQQPLGEWTVMPGLRMERFGRDIASPGRTSASVTRTAFFPTFHLERQLGKRMRMTASYSRRIDRPDAEVLRPYRVFGGGLSANQGNPELRDQTTDALELNLAYHHQRLDAGLILYNRETDRLWSTLYFVDPDGVSVSMEVNAGRQTDRGAQFDVSVPLLPRVKAMASINLFDSRIPIDPLASDDRARLLRYTGNATLEWRGRDHGKVPGSTALVQLEYQSPRRTFQIRYDTYVSLNLSWTHSFTRRWAVTAALSGIGADGHHHRLVAPLVQEDYRKRERLPELKFKLVRTFGNPD